ncbi:MAG TPA: chloride channel protein [Candidatus Binataceae bacterium]|nr:chloride channel protein [Candidatus Binataceae bacterium]
MVKQLVARLDEYPLIRRCYGLVREDLQTIYSRDIQKWLLVAPIIGVVSGLVVTAVTLVILNGLWARLLPHYLHHPWLILPGLLFGFVCTGLIMQYRTPNPDEHSTEEIIVAYHHRQGAVDVGPFWWKLLAAVTTVGFGGSAALEGPSIYAGGAIGSWLWSVLTRFRLPLRDRRIMLISGAAAGMAAVFRAPLTGLVFALEMPYKDDLAHEALLPSLIASVVAYAVLIGIVGSQPLFGFVGTATFSPMDILWSALLGLIIGVIAMIYTTGFRRARAFAINAKMPHTTKLLIGGALTALCGLLFIAIFPGNLIPIGPNYEAVREVLMVPHGSLELITFAVLKLLATLFSLGSGGVSAMFVPLFLVGGCFGSAFAQSVVHTTTFDLYAAVGMAAFIAAGYKTPLAAVVFVAETTAGHAFLIPSLVGAACAYAISGEASASRDQRLHEVVKLSGITGVPIREVMSRIAAIPATMRMANLAATAAAGPTVFPVVDGATPIGVLDIARLDHAPPDGWDKVTAAEACDRAAVQVSDRTDVIEVLRLFAQRDGEQSAMVIGADGSPEGVVTKSALLRYLLAVPPASEASCGVDAVPLDTARDEHDRRT